MTNIKEVCVQDVSGVAVPAFSTEAEPRRYYGWVMLPISMAALVATSPGQTFGITIFNEPMRQSLGLSHGQLAAAYMLGTLLAAVPLIYVGALMDRFGLRKSMLAAVFLLGLACLATSQVRGWWSLLVAFLLLRMLGPGGLSFLSSNTLAFWFHRRLGTIEGFRQLGMAGAMALFPAMALWLMLQFGWRGSFALLGLAVWAIMLPIVFLFFRNRPEDVGQVIDGGTREASDSGTDADSRTAYGPPILEGFTLQESLRSRAFWIVASGTSLFGLIHTAVFFSLVPIFFERGLGAAHAAQMVTVFAVSLASMQLIGGSMADRHPARFLLPMALCGLSAGVFLLMASTSVWAVNLSGAVMGMSQGLFFGTSNPLWARYYGRLHLGKIRGMLITINIASSSLGPLMFGLARDTLGSYHLILSVFALLPIPLVCLSFLATPPRKLADPVLP